MSRTICATCRSIMVRTPRTASGASPDRRISSSPVRIGASGLRSSWARSARNSSLRESASRSWRSDSAIVCARPHLRRDVAEVADDAVAAVRQRDAVDAPLVVLDRLAVHPVLRALGRAQRFAGGQRVAEDCDELVGVRRVPHPVR